LAIVAAAAGLRPAPAGATGIRPVVATASAQGIRATYSMPGYVAVSTLFDSGGPLSEATGDSTGRSVTFASLPYPGETAVFFPGVMAAATGVQPPAGYPFYARADYPTTPKSEVADPSGSYDLRAEADRGKSNGLATAQFIGEGVDAVSRSAAETHVTIDDDGNVTVVAESANWGLSMGGGALTIASVRSRSTSVYKQGSDRPEVTRELAIEGARAFKQSVTIGPDGVHVDDKSAPAPIAEGSKNLNDALKQSGISVRTVSAEGAGSADLLEVTSVHPVPVPGNPQGTFVYRFGAVTTAISLGPASDTDVSDAVLATPAGGSPSASSPSPEAPSIGAPPGTAPVTTPGDAEPETGSAGMTADERSLTAPVAMTGGAGSAALSGPSVPAASPSAAAPGVIRTRPSQTVPLQAARTFKVGGRLRLVYALLGLSAVLLVLSPSVWRLTRTKGTGQ
jgi:hypothetical protein